VAHLESLGFSRRETVVFFKRLNFRGSTLDESNAVTVQLGDQAGTELELGSQWTPLSFRKP